MLGNGLVIRRIRIVAEAYTTRIVRKTNSSIETRRIYTKAAAVYSTRAEEPYEPLSKVLIDTIKDLLPSNVFY